MRINIDEEWKSDPRRKHLAKRLGSERLADGMLVEIASILLANKGEDIPLSKFKFIENYEDWIESGLGHIRGELVHISGSDRYHDFFDKQQKNGAKGGRPNNPNKPKITQNNPNKPKITQNNPTVTQANPNNPSFSFSFSSSKKTVAAATGEALLEASLRPEDMDRAAAIMASALKRDLRINDKRRVAQILAHFGDPPSFALWAERVINNEKCPDVDHERMRFERYFGAALSNEFRGI